MTKTNETKLEELSLEELNIMQAHVRLGEGHLKKYLNNQQINALLNLAPLKQQQIDNIKSDRAERSGHIALVFNTIITGSFGAWLGFSGFMRLSLDSLTALACITAVAMCASGSVGYYTFKLTKNTAKKAFLAQKLHNLQLKILHIILNKRQSDVDNMVRYLSRSLDKLDDSAPAGADAQEGSVERPGNKKYSFETTESITAWLNELYQILQTKSESIKSEAIYQFYVSRLNDTSTNLKEFLSKNLALKDKSQAGRSPLQEAKKKKKVWAIEKPDATTSFTRVLTDPTIAAPRDEVKNRSWLRDNVISLFVGLAPTLMGGFSSMFVFLSGAPSVAKDFGLIGVENFLRHPISQIVEFAIAVALTIYYGFSHIHNNRKSYVRSHELEKTRKMIANEESKLIELNTKFNTLDKARDQIRFIFDTYEALDIFAQYSLEKQKEINQHLNTIKLLKAKGITAASGLGLPKKKKEAPRTLITQARSSDKSLGKAPSAPKQKESLNI